MTVTVDQSKLILNSFAAHLQNNLLSSELVTWNKFKGEMNDRNALTVVEQVPPRFVTTQTADGVKDLTGGVQSMVFGSEQYKVNRTFGSSMGYGDWVKIRDLGEARESQALKNCALNLAEAIDGYIMGELVNYSPKWVGTPANDIADLGDVLSAYTRLKEGGVPDEGLRMILNYTDKQKLAETLVAYPATDSLSTQAFRNGFAGEIGGIPTAFTQQLRKFTVGNDVTGVAVDGAAQEVDYVDVAVSSAPGRYKTQTLHVDGVTTGTGTVATGSVFTIADVYEWDNRANQSTGRLQQFVVVSGGTASGVSDIDLVIYPAIIVQGTSDINTAHATVDSAPADDAAITFVGAASTAYTPRLMLNKYAAVVHTADLIMPAVGEGSRKSLTKVPLSVRMWKHSDFHTGAHSIRFDCALTANVHRRDEIIRFNG